MYGMKAIAGVTVVLQLLLPPDGVSADTGAADTGAVVLGGLGFEPGGNGLP